MHLFLSEYVSFTHFGHWSLLCTLTIGFCLEYYSEYEPVVTTYCLANFIVINDYSSSI
jgi:hypothetical protein